MIYFIQAEDSKAIKIGIADNPQRRLAALATGSAEPLTLLGVQHGVKADEIDLHRRFRSLRLKGEWFQPGQDLLDYINQYAFPYTAEELFWAELVTLEPRLATLLARARAIKDDKTRPVFCANAAWYGYGRYEGQGLKTTLEHLVGWYAESRHPKLRSREAYDLVYKRVYKVLPNCRNCMCA